jgi:hypothetical protein
MALLKKQQQVVEIKVYYREVEVKPGFIKIVALTDEDVDKLTKDDKVTKKIQCLTTKWKILNWKEQNDLTGRSTLNNDFSGNQSFAWWVFRDLKLKKCLVGWDMIDENNVPIPLNEENIDSLPGEIVSALYNKYDSVMALTGEEEKK